MVQLFALPQAPLATITYNIHLYHLRHMLEELAWTEDLPVLTRLVLRQDSPRREQYLPRPLTTDQDQLTQQELLRRNDRDSNALLLLRHTGMRIGECADLSFDCLHRVGSDDWAIHVPLGKLKTERMVPVDAFVCQLVDRLRVLRSQDSLPADGFLLTRPSGRNVLIQRLRTVWRNIVAAAGITTRIVPHQLRHSFRNGDAPCWRYSTRCNEVARTPQSRDDYALSGGLHARLTARVSSGSVPAPPSVTPVPVPCLDQFPPSRPRLSAQDSPCRSARSRNVPSYPFPRTRPSCTRPPQQSTHQDHFRNP